MATLHHSAIASPMHASVSLISASTALPQCSVDVVSCARSTRSPVPIPSFTMTVNMVRTFFACHISHADPHSSGLIRWKFVTHCFVDGHARFVTGIRVHTNNRGETVLMLFLETVRRHGVPSRVRGDHGTENIRVAEWMEATRGLNRGSYIWGRCVSSFSHLCSLP